jgi:beta-N-acetylhexosaminidase
MGPPHWPKYPAGSAYGRVHANDPLVRREIARLGARLMAHDLLAVGINVDCVPVLDVPVPGSHEIIGDRAYGRDPQTVAVLGRAAAEGLMAGGVLPVIKHVPGHGRAFADSHLALPVVETRGRSWRRTTSRPSASWPTCPSRCRRTWSTPPSIRSAPHPVSGGDR